MHGPQWWISMDPAEIPTKQQLHRSFTAALGLQRATVRCQPAQCLSLLWLLLQ
jgi:hypothetical protein